MKLKIESPQKALKSYFIQRPTENERDKFKKNLIDLLEKISVVENSKRVDISTHFFDFIC